MISELIEALRRWLEDLIRPKKRKKAAPRKKVRRSKAGPKKKAKAKKSTSTRRK